MRECKEPTWSLDSSQASNLRIWVHACTREHSILGQSMRGARKKKVILLFL